MEERRSSSSCVSRLEGCAPFRDQLTVPGENDSSAGPAGCTRDVATTVVVDLSVMSSPAIDDIVVRSPFHRCSNPAGTCLSAAVAKSKPPHQDDASDAQ